MSHASPLSSPPKSTNKLFRSLAIRADIALIAVLAVAEVEIFYSGIDVRLASLVVASISSMAILYGINKGARNKLVIVLSYVPYLFGMYLLFVEGFWRLVQLVQGFTVQEVALIIFYFVVGSSMSSCGYNATLQVQRLRQSH